jgi:hypothetical protein
VGSIPHHCRHRKRQGGRRQPLDALEVNLKWSVGESTDKETVGRRRRWINPGCSGWSVNVDGRFAGQPCTSECLGWQGACRPVVTGACLAPLGPQAILPLHEVSLSIERRGRHSSRENRCSRVQCARRSEVTNRTGRLSPPTRVYRSEQWRDQRESGNVAQLRRPGADGCNRCATGSLSAHR